MRFHHSTRRGRNRLASHRLAYHHPTSTSRWSQLGYCRETSITFNRRLTIEPPPATYQLDLPPTVKSLAGLPESGSREEPSLVLLREEPPKGNSGGMPAAGEFSRKLRENPSRRERASKSSSRKLRRLEGQLENLRLQDSGKLTEDNKEQAVNDLNPNRSPNKLDMEFIREKLRAQVEKHPFWSNKAAKRMQLTSCRERNVYIYELTSYCERRELEWRFEAYRGGGLVSTIPNFRRKLSSDSTGGSGPPGGQLTGSPTDLPTNFNQPLVVPDPLLSPRQPIPAARWSVANSLKMRRDNYLAKMEQLSGINRKEDSSQQATELTPADQQQPANANAALRLMDRFIPSPEQVWALEIPEQHRPELFTGYVYTSEFPNSSFVKRCHGCQGKGRIKCATCHGVGYEVCLGCSGKGTHRSSHHSSSSLQPFSSPFSKSSRNSSRALESSDGYYEDNYNSSSGKYSKRSYGEPGGIAGAGVGAGSLLTSSWAMESCHSCNGSGQKRCVVCTGKSHNYCFACIGTGQLRCFLKLIVTWINHREDILVNNADNIIPKERLRLCSGLVLVEQVANSLEPLPRTWIDGATGELDEANQIHQASRKLLYKHRTSYLQERILKERHKVIQIECHVVNYEWKTRSGHFVIYGDEQKVYIAKWPFKSVCNIT